ncbi:MAG: peptidase M28, partial [Planctomycetota bacterium]
MSTPRVVLWLLLSSAAVSCASGDPTDPRGQRQWGVDSIRAEDLERHIQTLSSDEYEGRLPGTVGEKLTVRYLVDQFHGMGLTPVGGAEGYVQSVPLVGITADPSMKLVARSGNRELSLDYGNQFMAWTKQVVTDIEVQDSPLVFVGYGAVATEFGWDDFKGIDVRDKTLIMLVNDPQVKDSKNPSQLDPKVFGGKAMTYYGRWTYKFEMAAQKGARACFVIHEPVPAGYPWAVVEGSWSGEQFDLVSPDQNRSRAAVEGWLQYESAKQLFQ